jgi:hypothetical protein
MSRLVNEIQVYFRGWRLAGDTVKWIYSKDVQWNALIAAFTSHAIPYRVHENDANQIQLGISSQWGRHFPGSPSFCVVTESSIADPCSLTT